MSGEKVINKIADDGIRLVSQFGHYPTNQHSAAGVPFQIDCAVKIAAAVDFRPAVRTAWLFCPDFDESEFLFQLRVTHDLAP